MRVLIAEDDAALALFLTKGLELEGYCVEVAVDGQAAIASALRLSPDLLVLDLNLPGKDGVEVLKALQQVRPSVSTLILTGRSSVEDRVACLDLGADDYLQKPFSLQELLARCRAIRRRIDATPTLIVHGDLNFDRIRRMVVRAGIRVELTAKELTLLDYLLQHRGRVIERAELLTNVFQISSESETNVIDVYISYLRTKLKVKPDLPQLIETVRRRGYTMPLNSVPGSHNPVQAADAPQLHAGNATDG